MSDEPLPPEEADLNEVNSQLDQGLQTCRSVVANYRSLLSGDDAHPADNDNDDGEGESLSGIDER